MATYSKVNIFVEHLADGVHNCSSDQFAVALMNNANAPSAANSVLADLTEISYANLSSRNLTTSVHGQTGGMFTQLFADLVLTASGVVAAFRHMMIFNDTPTSPADPLVGYYDYGSELVMNNGETFTADFTTATFTLA